MEFKNELRGNRIILKRNISDLTLARTIFRVINSNREHLKKWFEWEASTKKVKDTLNYLSENDKRAKKSDKIEYGIYVEDKYIGNISAFNIDTKNKSVEFGYWISSKFTRKGYVTEAVKILEKEFFENFNFNRIKIKCDEKNIASQGVAKKCGYKLEGTFRQDAFIESQNRFRNTKVFSKLKSEYKKD